MTAAAPSHLSTRVRSGPAAALGLLAAMALPLLTGCSGSASGGSTASSQSLAAPEGLASGSVPGTGDAGNAAGSAASPQATAGKSANGTDLAATAAASTARLIRTGQVTLEVHGRLDTGAGLIRSKAAQFGGHVESETTGYTEPADQKPAGGSGQPSTAAPGESLIVLRIPEAKFDAAMTSVTVTAQTSGWKVLSQTSSTQDVTGDIADLTSRVATQRASLDRVRALMNRAVSLQDVVTLESELSRRESDLEALESRLAVISDQADLSTLTVLLRTAAAIPAVAAPADSGFLAGLRAGWHGLVTLTTATLTVVGALLPFAVALTVVGWPVWLLVRRLRHRGAPPRVVAPSAPLGGTPPTP
jgi:hypothetical protein